MYYVVQVRSGDEERCMLEFGLHIKKDILQECFVPHFEEKKENPREVGSAGAHSFSRIHVS